MLAGKHFRLATGALAILGQSILSSMVFAAEQIDVATTTTEICLNADPNFDHISGLLEKAGWDMIEIGNSDEDLVRAISAERFTKPLMFAPPNPQWKGTWQWLLENDAGLNQVPSPEGFPVSINYFVYGEYSGVLKLVITRPPKPITMACIVVAKPALAERSLTLMSHDISKSKNEYPVVLLKPRKYRNDQASHAIFRTIFDGERISAVIDETFPYVGIIEIHGKFESGEGDSQ